MRNIININNGWKFTKKNETTELNLPHTWNGIDGQDGGNDYYRGTCVYQKEISADEIPDGENVYIQFDGVNSSAKVYFNDKEIKVHHGGYSAFRAKLENIKEHNEIKVEVDNSPNDYVYPQNADFTFYGGIYRNVTLIGVPKNHFDLDYFGAPGIMVTPKFTENSADIEIEVFLNIISDTKVYFQIVDKDNNVLETKESCIISTDKHSIKANLNIDKPHLWNGRIDPYLYTARAFLINCNEKIENINNLFISGNSYEDSEFIEDYVSTKFGIRTFEMNAEKGFILNGKEYALRGVSRHQDRPNIGNALLPKHHKEDIELIFEMGANTIRLAHYQHDQYFYDLCDEKGLIVWAEIPYISSHMANGVENTLSQMKELICQCYNHPSIVTWGLSNEISMSGSSAGLVENHKKLNNLAHSLDKTRPTTTAVVTMCSIDSEYVHISDILSYNHYFGWYGGTVDMYGQWFDKFHKKYPNKAIGMSEYGCEALNWHTSNPEQGDYTEEYQAYYHEEVIKQIIDRPYLWATHVWNMFDFAADARAEGGENGMNHKGLVTFDRKYKKDSFYAYQAWLSDNPMLHISGKRYVDRVEDITKITVYSNQPQVELFVNGKCVGKQKKGKYPFFYFNIDNEGTSSITAKAGDLTDESTINKVDKFNESYRMKEEGTVINWFEINTPVGYYSVNDTLGDIMATFRGKIATLKIGKIILSALKENGSNEKDSKKIEEGKEKKKANIMGMDLSLSMLKTALSIGKGFTIRRAISMLGGKFTKEQILEINAILNKVKKSK